LGITAASNIFFIVELRQDRFVIQYYSALAVKKSNKHQLYVAIQEYTNVVLIDSE
jgi:hypothetical protein